MTLQSASPAPANAESIENPADVARIIARARMLVAVQHAALQHVADDLGVRILHIKGLVARQELGTERGQPSDVDILVDPLGMSRLCDRLGDLGWAPADLEWATNNHATVLAHPMWGATADIHIAIPGMGRTPQQAFELLYRNSHRASIAHRPCAVPDTTDHALLLILHDLRTPQRGVASALAIWNGLDRSRQGELHARARALGCPGYVEALSGQRGPWRLRVWQAAMRPGAQGAIWRWVGEADGQRSLRGKTAYVVQLLRRLPPEASTWSHADIWRYRAHKAGRALRYVVAALRPERR